MAFRSANSATGLIGGTGLSCNAPAGVTSGDELRAVVFVDVNGLNVTPPSGWAAIGARLDNSGPDGQSSFLFRKRAGGSEPGSYAFTCDSDRNATIIIGAWSGRADDAGAAVQSVNTSGNSSPVSIAATGITATAGDDIAWFASLDTTGTGAKSFAPPSSYTERADVDSGDWTCGTLATRDNVSAGDTGTLTGTGTAADGAGWAAFVVRLPSAGGSAPTISAGTPTGTVGPNPTVGFTTDTNSGTARIVIDTAANLSGVTATQVLAGQKNNSTAAAFDSGNITVTTTSPSYAFSGLQGGTTYTIAAAQNSTSNSNVLTWTFTVGVYPSGITTTSNQGSISVQIIEGVSITGEAITTSQGTLVPAVINNGTNGLGSVIIDFGAGNTTTTATVAGQTNITSGSFVDAFVMGTDSTDDHSTADHAALNLNIRCTAIDTGADTFTLTATSPTSLTGKYLCRWVWTH